ncbi:hypothetical protein [Longimicrobium terrae]|nr:hypothetical protein [Longimicrobium terrae]MBB4636282.1 hypothetical protein [Longimicrobium terrae]NNC29660.1 hypothetical protein [Longimicrobium terrae]
MMKRFLRGLAMAGALVLGTSSVACAGTGWEDVLSNGGGLYDRQISGEVRGVNTRARRIELRTDRGGYETVRYDSRTEVVYGNRRYAASSLRQGDWVSLRVSRDRRGDQVAERVTVRESARDRSARSDDRYDRRNDRRDDRRDDNRGRYDGRSAVRSLDGRVGRVDRNRRMFEVRTSQGTVWATVVGATSRERDRIRDLRAGEYVRLRGRFTSNSRFEVESFR